MKRKFKLLGLVSTFIGVCVIFVNLYGLQTSIRVTNLTEADLRFSGDYPKPYEDALVSLERLLDESDYGYALRQNDNISETLAHIKWEDLPAEKYNLTVPVWENFLLFAVGKLTRIPEFEKYHFTIPEKSLERGIGICGDASMTLSTLLNRQGIENKIVSFPGHVMVTVSADGKETLFDPDFGVVLPFSAEEASMYENEIIEAYIARGYSYQDASEVAAMIVKDYSTWNGASHFVTKKYYFERISYLLKWLIPFILLLPLIFALFNQEFKRSRSDESFT